MSKEQLSTSTEIPKHKNALEEKYQTAAELTEDRKKDRSDESKQLLLRLKKTKLAIKDAIAKAKSKFR